MSARDALPRTREGLSAEAFAVIGDRADPDTWKVPHHRRSIIRAVGGRLDVEKTVDWRKMPSAAAALSPRGGRGRAVELGPEEVLRAARHLADHYVKAGRSLPDILAAFR